MTTRDHFYDQLMTEGASSETAFLLLSELRRDGKPQKVIQESLRALARFPSDLKIRKLLAEAYFEAGLMAQAEAEAEKAATLVYEALSVFKLQAQIFAKQGRVHEALESLKIPLASDPDDEEALGLFERLRPGEETPVTTDSAADTAATTGPLPDIATPTLAEVYFSQGQRDKAAAIYERIIEKNPEDDQSKQRLAEIRSSETPPVEILTPEPPTDIPESAIEVDGVEETEEGIMESVLDAAEPALRADSVPMAEDDATFDENTAKKQKMLSVLETWRKNIRGLSKTSAPA